MKKEKLINGLEKTGEIAVKVLPDVIKAGALVGAFVGLAAYSRAKNPNYQAPEPEPNPHLRDVYLEQECSKVAPNQIPELLETLNLNDDEKAFFNHELYDDTTKLPEYVQKKLKRIQPLFDLRDLVDQEKQANAEVVGVHGLEPRTDRL